MGCPSPRGEQPGLSPSGAVPSDRLLTVNLLLCRIPRRQEAAAGPLLLEGPWRWPPGAMGSPGGCPRGPARATLIPDASGLMLPLVQPWPRRGHSTRHSDPRGQARPQNRSPSIRGHLRPGSEAGPCSRQAREQTRGPDTRVWQSAPTQTCRKGEEIASISLSGLGRLRLSLYGLILGLSAHT